MIEENKKKLEELNLSLLTKSLWETASPKPSPVKQVKKRKIDVGSESFERMTSGRLSDKPAPNYRDVMDSCFPLFICLLRHSCCFGFDFRVFFKGHFRLFVMF
ncbi:hypothetical protein QJS10_CPB04g01576 [Acorus calamus]|uniref:Uncharacterized protein n=1 Tax=Acorus calamus TaxID=4465 RepID=A0AAV9F237_ACOCL|nr:hypothetical protein QJS10_CPB04g01576 [Acorus calamus]